MSYLFGGTPPLRAVGLLSAGPSGSVISHTSGSAFRLDINALRALSVLAVLGFHLKIPGFAGGFIGVDVFLVITGYLMTRKVVEGLEAGHFSVRDFWLMRFRRIYPALAIVTILSAVAGWFVTLPGEYLRHLRQASYALVFLSNFAFDNDHGYFALPAQTKPLLHTWSLAVEWQFYIWMPIIASLAWHRWARSKSGLSAVIVAIQIAAALSLVWCLWASSHDASSTFFSLRARAWEPLVGGLIAALEIRRRSQGGLRLAWFETGPVGAAGWVLVSGCVVYPLPESQWPGVLTILPVLGGAMIVGARQWTSAGTLLAAHPIQRIGDWSYSIYLWHWPIWVCALTWISLRGDSLDATAKALIALLSVALGALSYHCVEQPFRLRKDIWTPRRLMRGSVAVFLMFFAFTIAAIATTGFPGRLPEYLQGAELARKTDTPRDECFRNSNSTKKASETYCSFGRADTDAKATAILWGDSFANQYLVPISSATLASGIHGLIATQSACRAFVDDPVSNSADQPACREFNRTTLDFVLGQAGPNIIVLGSNWSNATEISVLVDRLLSSGKAVILIMPLLNVGFDVPQKWLENQFRAGKAIPEWKVEANPSLTNSRLRQELAELLSGYRDNPRLITVDPQSVVCQQGYCYLVRHGQANFRDTAHISNVNASQYRSLFDESFVRAHATQPARER
ncbi:acyltransferase [Bradyrhizobium sp. 2]|uniref:acyltransferase family protein n=1 Tax=Bradyrhizobium sp. 2 TaxID=190045 RepID=UPI001FFA86C3|nr:acyltransferase family protein [Bradyrhizobium sp. 2]MCK1460653.1 acyltransferase [Bradyrhizobium sp. 2]